MSSEYWVEPSSEGRADETGLEKQQEEVAEKGEVEVPCGHNQPARSLALEVELRGNQPLSPDRTGMQEVSSKEGAEQAQREKMQTQEKRERFSHMTNNQKSRDKVSGVWRKKWDAKCDRTLVV